jgi:pyridoxal phosphate enzyme (YggS family)
MKSYEDLRDQISSYGARLTAVSKTRSEEEIMKLYSKGQRIFGENRVQELIAKAPNLPDDIQWHLIGHLQTNKVKYIAPFVAMIEAVDSAKLLKEINKQARKSDRQIRCLLQMRIAEEETKFGMTLTDAEEIIKSCNNSEFPHVTLAGVMGMATFTSDQQQVRREFKQLHAIFDQLKEQVELEQDEFKEISMGMSGDYLIALEEGSTMVRIGTLIFGPRS